MSSDQFLVFGIILFGLSIPSLLQGASEGRMPRIGALMALAGAVMVAYAASHTAGGYDLPEIPGIFRRVIGDMMN